MRCVLVFGAGEERYALACEHVVEVVSAVEFRPLRHVPDWVCGVFNYRGAVVPAIDLRMLLTEEPCADSLSTRLILVRWPGEHTNALVGILAEHVSDLRRVDTSRRTGLRVAAAPYLGAVALNDGSMVQTIDLAGIPLPEVLLDSVPAACPPAAGRHLAFAGEADDARANRRAP